MESKKIEDILKEISNEENMVVIGERKWSKKLADKVLSKSIQQGETGIFFSNDINSIDYTDCVRLYFFNKDKQYFCIKLDESENFYYKFSNIKAIGNQVINYKNLCKENAKSRFKFALDIGTIPDFINEDTIKIIIEENTKEWRFSL